MKGKSKSGFGMGAAGSSAYSAYRPGQSAKGPNWHNKKPVPRSVYYDKMPRGRAYPLPGPSQPAGVSVRSDLTNAIAASERRAMMDALRRRGVPFE